MKGRRGASKQKGQVVWREEGRRGRRGKCSRGTRSGPIRLGRPS